VYRPAAFDVPDIAQLHDAIDLGGLAHLVSLTAHGLTGSVVPLLIDRDRGPNGTLVGHLARANRHWRDVVTGTESMAIFAGPDAYVSPSWYATKQETGKVVPTWNYEVIHAHGPLVVHDDPLWLEHLVRRLTAHHEAGRPEPWSVDDAPADFISGQLRAIVGIEVPITRLEGKRKLSQNRSASDVAGAINGLTTGTATEREVALRMSRAAR
jgi:transcriptional regulator